MPEILLGTMFNIDPEDPLSILGRIFERKFPGTIRQNIQHIGQVLIGTNITLTGQSEEDMNPIAEIWHSITGTKDFESLQHAFNGDTTFFKELAHDYIISDSPDSKWNFYDFLRALAYEKAIRKNQGSLIRDEITPSQVELRLERRRSWIKRLTPPQKLITPVYIHRVLMRLYNLTTTGEEKRTWVDRGLDWIIS
ncbi:hypothetical protein HYT18_03995 [Candidatus Microgenomates bacterium]|nr:hypothetical protein [Candidatus Microgenomates bacterium]